MYLMDTLPEALEAIRMNDDFSAETYESMTQQKRALIKNALAFHFSLQAQIQETESYRFNKNSGFLHGYQQKTCDYALFVLPQNFGATAKFIASISPAIIAGVENIFVFMPDNVTDSIWASLELAGIEQVFVVPNAEFSYYSEILINFLEEKNLSCGRVVLFGENEMVQQLENHDLIYHVDTKKLSMYAYEKQKDILTFAHGDMDFYTVPLETKEEITDENIHNNIKWMSKYFDVKIEKCADISFSKNYPALQYFEEDMELCYVHPHVDKNFFMDIRISTSFVVKELI